MNTANFDTHTYRRPKQQRGVLKFEALLDTAEQLIENSGIEKFSLYDVAEIAQVTSGSVYHFFPSVEALLIALAERHLDKSVDLVRSEISENIASWVDLWRYISAQSRDYYNQNRVSAMLLLGPGASWTIRSVDADGNRRIAIEIVKHMERLFYMPDYPGLEGHLVRAITISDALWQHSYREHGMITDIFWQDSIIACTAYLRYFYAPTIPARKDVDKPDLTAI